VRKPLKDIRLDTVGIFLHLMVVSLFGISVIGAFLTLLDVDAIFLFIKVMDLNPVRAGSRSLLLFAFRFAIQSVLLYAMVRSVSFVLVAALLGLKIIIHCIKLLKQRILKVWNVSNSFASFQKQIIVYQCLNIIVYGYLDVFSSPFAFAIMSVGLALEVASVFIIIRVRVLVQLSLPTYVCIIILTVIIPLICEAMLPEGIRVAEDTKNMLRNWNLKFSFSLLSRDRKYYIKKLRSLRPCTIYAGGLGNVHFYPLVKSTKATYYSLTTYYVINTLISVPESITLGF
jgi:hypothetical protein